MNFTIDSRPERNYKDRLFKAIFGRDTPQSKLWRLELYNALNGTSYTDPDALVINTIENVIYLTMRNDISFLVDSQMTLYEQQSTYNPNMHLLFSIMVLRKNQTGQNSNYQMPLN